MQVLFSSMEYRHERQFVLGQGEKRETKIGVVVVVLVVVVITVRFIRNVNDKVIDF